MRSDRWMRLLLRLYPGEFRRRFGDDMVLTFRANYSERQSVSARSALLVGSLLDAIGSAAAEWWQYAHQGRSMRLLIEDWRQAMTHAFRSLARHPGFALVTGMTLALGVGATTAMFSVFNAALLRPLPYPNADRLVAIAESRGADEISISYPDLIDLGRRSRTLESVAGFFGRSFALTEGGEPERIRGQSVTSNLFQTLGVSPILGRSFLPAEDATGAPPVVAISHALWTRRLGADRNVVGKPLLLDGVPYTIVAVMPEGFRFPDGLTYGPADAWVSMSTLGDNDRINRDNHPGIVGIGLRRESTSLAAARADLTEVSAALAQEYPASNAKVGVIVRSGVDAIVGKTSNAILLLFGAAIVVLLVACANVAGLMLIRAESRRKEFAIKAALGAEGFRVAANVAGEAILLSVVGCLGGAALAYGLLQLFAGATAGLPRLEALSLDLRALVFAVALSAGVAIACALAPLLWARDSTARAARQNRGASSTSRLRDLFASAQVAMSLVLVVTASLLLRAFERMTGESGGIEPERVSTFTIQLPDSRYAVDAARITFARELIDRLAQLPGVNSAALVSVLPFSGSGSQSGIGPAGGTREDERRTDVAAVTPDYFRAMGIELVRGRTFSASDDASAPPVAVVDERFAEALWPGGDAIGKQVEGWGKPSWTVIGVVRHVKSYGVAAESRQQFYAAYAQRPTSRAWVVIKSSANAASDLAAARTALREVDPQLPAFGARTMRDIVDTTVAGPRLAALLSTGYAVTALLVVIIGIHGAVAFLVRRRTREIGVRVALGASRPDVVRLIAGQSFRLIGIGTVLGVAGSVAVARVIRGQLFGVSVIDVPTLAVAALAILLTGVLSSAFPMWRALSIPPTAALNND